MMSNRREFTKQTRRDALKRSGLRCEATGAMYGLPTGQRCNADLSYGVEYDHIVLDANSKDNSLENCASVCPKCHRWKTDHHDIPMAAKTVRMQDKANGIRKTPASKLKGPGFAKAAKPERVPKDSLPPLPRRPLYTPNTGYDRYENHIQFGNCEEGDRGI